MVANRWRTDLIYRSQNSDRLSDLNKHPNELYQTQTLKHLEDAGFNLHKTKIVAPSGVRPDDRIHTRWGHTNLAAEHHRVNDPRSIIHEFTRHKSSLYRAYQKKREQGRGFRLLITAKRSKLGVGKTTLAIILAKAFDDHWSADRATLQVNEFINLYQNLDRGSCILFDDIEQAVNRRRAMSHQNVNFLQTIQGMRYREVSTIITAPTIKTIDKGLETFADYRIHVLEPGTGVVCKYQEPPGDNGPSDEIELNREHRIHWQAIDDDPDYQAVEDKKQTYMGNQVSQLQQPSQQQTRQAKQEAKKEQRDKIIHRMDQQGYTQQEIAEILDISQSTVSRVLR